MTTTSLPPSSQRPDPSPITQLLTTSTPDRATSPLALPLEILHNLRHQHAWTDLTLHYIPPTSSSRTLHPLSLPLSTLPPSLTDASTASTTPILISGQPPRPVYIHPDEQTALLKAKTSNSTTSTEIPSSDGASTTTKTTPAPTSTPPTPGREYVLPLSLTMTPSIAFLSGIFDALPAPPSASSSSTSSSSSVTSSSASTSSSSSSEQVPTLSLPTTTKQQRPSSPHVPSSAETQPAGTTNVNISDGTSSGTSSGTGAGPRAEPGAGPGNGIGGKRVLLAIKGPDGTIAYYVCLEGEVKPRQNG